MGDTIGPKIELKGEAQFKKALREIDAGLRVNAAELRKAGAEFDKNDKSMEALTARSDVLQRSIASQGDKVNMLRAALADSARENGEASQKTMNYAAKLASAEAEMAKMNRELGENEKAMKESKSGLADLDTALQALDDRMRVNAAETRKVTEAYDKNDKSVESLTAKSELLQKSAETQRSKVDALREALSKSAQEYGDADRRTVDYKERLNDAEAALIRTNRELGENEKALKKAQSGTTSLGDAVRRLSDMMGIRVPPVMQGMVSKLDGINASGAALVGVLGGVVAGLAGMSIKTAKTADDILTLSTNTGLSIETIQELRYSAEFLEVSVETVSSSMARLVKNMNTAKGGSGEAAEAFRKMRVQITSNNGQLRDQEQVFYDVIDALGKTKNETQRNAYAMAIFGRSAQELTTMIESGSKGMKQLAEEAHNMGYVMSDQTVEQFGQLDDAMQKLNNQGEALKNSLAVALLPVLTRLFEVIGSIPVPVLQTLIVLGGVVTTVILAVKAIKQLTDTGSAIKGFFTGLNPATLKTTAIILGVVAALVALGLVIAAITGKKQDMIEMSRAMGDSVGKIQGNINDVQNSYQRAPGYARGTSNHPGGRAVVGENGPEVVDLPRGSKVYPTGVAPTGGQNVYITVQAKDLQQMADVVALFERFTRTKNAGTVPV